MASRRDILRAAALGSVAVGVTAAGLRLSGPGGGVVPGRSRARSVQGDSITPRTAAAVVIGGGIVGASTALYLAKAGVEVVLCEKGAVAGEASGRAQGVVSSAGLDPSKLELVNLSKSLWAGLNRDVDGETGYRRTGLVIPYLEHKEEENWRAWIQAAGDGAPGARLLTAAQANSLLPAATRWRGAFSDSSDGGVEPTLAAPAVAEGARRLGAKILVPCAVRGLETSAGKVSAVVTEKGRITTSAVVLAAGSWSTPFAENNGIRLPTIDIFSSLLRVRFSEDAGNMPGLFRIPSATLRRHIDGTYSLGAQSGQIPITPRLMKNLWSFRKVITDPPWDVHPRLGSYFFRECLSAGSAAFGKSSPFEDNRILQPADNTDLLENVARRIREEFPRLGKMSIVERWSGALNVTPDNVPVVSEVPAVPGLFLATGFSYGLTMGPAAGKLVSELVTGVRSSVGLERYRYSRFIDGSQLAFTH